MQSVWYRVQWKHLNFRAVTRSNGAAGAPQVVAADLVRSSGKVEPVSLAGTLQLPHRTLM